jgi:uncharacterized repeat protein (TIGR03803 family)
MREISWWKTAYAVCVLCAATAIALPAQTFTTLFSFDGTDGALPEAALVQGTDGNLYGTTWIGGANGGACNGGCGTVFKISLSGTLTTLYSFCSLGGRACTDGAAPEAGLVEGADGSFYGTTPAGGSTGANAGTVFKISPSGTLTTLYSFCPQGDGCIDGFGPIGSLVQATDGNFYGTTSEGGDGSGTIFKITPVGVLTTLYTFVCSEHGCPDGEIPEGALIQASDGNFYGTTTDGGAYGLGTIFETTPSGNLTTLYSFCSQIGCADGKEPTAGLAQSVSGNFYGTTPFGGNSTCTYGCGTVFKITPSGVLTTLQSFSGADGAGPYGELIRATNGNFYGTTSYDGAKDSGTIFKITPSGALTTLYSFCSQSGCADGDGPLAALVQDTNGKFYGTTAGGGANLYGTVFSLSVGLGPFVETRPTAATVGKPINIVGSSLVGATSVTFNGTPATFTVESSSLIRTTVPSGATTGTVQVVTPGGTLTSNVPFRVLP